ncbi:hypothetical protein B5V89_17520 [Heyndrickxia sporothermodurans]|uniref:hypothetical protein n=2 Tax=Heyndrickxia sporothermodurans TaxID=46224 RepID=UPI000D33367F|nr:hypothetical protein [Heyndrickxia sporothermodurans]PTY76598.1 hypothetical protein B5V89_17520 [Heyndrickxia sporothermodurans]
MDKVSLIILLVVGLLIFRQFIPKEVKRFDLIGLPILGLIKTYSGLPKTLDVVIMAELFCLLILAAVIGYFQAKKTKVVYHNGKLSTIGGVQYIIGWLVLLIGRIIILFLFNFTVFKEALYLGKGHLKDEIILLVSNSGDWLIWSTIAASSILYSLTLYKDHPEIKEFIHTQVKQKRQDID